MSNPLYYFDIIIQESLDNNSSDSIGIFPIASKVFQVIHGINKSGDPKLSIDFIKNKTDEDNQFLIRLFNGDRIWLIGVVSELSNHYIVRDYTKITQPARSRKPKEFVVNRRKRVHDKKSIAREESLKYCRTLFHFHLTSKSNCNPYIVSIEQILSTVQLEGEIKPNNYGLSTNDVKFSLPRF